VFLLSQAASRKSQGSAKLRPATCNLRHENKKRPWAICSRTV